MESPIGKNEGTAGTYTKDEIVTILLLSFRYSQGEGNLQKYFFEWMVLNYSAKKLPKDTSSALIEATSRAEKIVMGSGARHTKYVRIGKYPKSSTPPDLIKKSAIADNISVYFKVWQDSEKSRANLPQKEKLIYEICYAMMGADRKFLAAAEHPRKNSFYVDFVLTGKASGSPAFDELFRQCRQYHEEHKAEARWRDRLALLYDAIEGKKNQ